MGFPDQVSRDDEIAQVVNGAPHVVILGAGASRAALPDGDANGRKLPLMADFEELVPVSPLLEEAGLPTLSGDFEAVYSALAADPELRGIRSRVDDVVYQYFDALRLPDYPTLYDHLILGLRSKDVVATFNWDPFLIQAARRSPALTEHKPLLLFLHGNVASGFCPKDEVHGVKGAVCSRCGEAFTRSSLLYPITDKDYESAPQIRNAWAVLRQALGRAFWVTVFGYSAPTSDVSARRLLREAWGHWESRQFEQLEFIDVRQRDDLLTSWSDFVHSHHYDVHDDFWDSWIPNHPRRTLEAYINQFLEARFIEDNPIPRDLGFGELARWVRPLVAAEMGNPSGGTDV